MAPGYAFCLVDKPLLDPKMLPFRADFNLRVLWLLTIVQPRFVFSIFLIHILDFFTLHSLMVFKHLHIL